MVLSRGPHKIERVTITLVPTSDEASFRHVPTTFNTANRVYAWRHFEKIDYMIVPKKISNREIKVDIFVDALKSGKAHASNVQRVVQQFVKSKIDSEWRGLKLGGIGKAIVAEPPAEAVKRGTIEEILGANLEE